MEVDIGDPQVRDFLRPCAGVIEHQEESPVAKREISLFRKTFK